MDKNNLSLKKNNTTDKISDDDQLSTIEQLKEEILNQKLIIKKLKSLIEVNSIISSTLNKKKLLKNILNQTKILMKCCKSSILLVDPTTNELKFEILSNEEEKNLLSSVRLKIGEGIAGYVWQTAKPILIKNVYEDKRFCKKADEKTDSETKSIIASPLIVNNNVIGVMEAINTGNDHCFGKFDLEILNALSIQAAIALDNAKLYELATTDGLTGLFIHRYFQQRLEEEFNRALRYKNDLSILMLDLDHFKEINDIYGHQTGDEILKESAKLIKKLSRTVDLPCRYGGEEFVVILPQTCEKNAMLTAERIRAAIENLNLVFENKKINISISGGVCSLFKNHPKNKDEFIKMADIALYFSKHNGRNQITEYTNDLV